MNGRREICEWEVYTRGECVCVKQYECHRWLIRTTVTLVRMFPTLDLSSDSDSKKQSGGNGTGLGHVV